MRAPSISFGARCKSSRRTTCAPASVAAPTQDTAAVQQQIAQSVQMTVAAQNTQTTQQQALIAPSNTPLPTQTAVDPATPTPDLPTATAFVIVPPTNTAAPASNNGSTVVVQRDYACEVITQSPTDFTVFKPNKTFDIRWIIVNTGTKTMAKGLDVKYFSGNHIATVARVELPELKPGASQQVIIDAKSSSTPGTYTTVWTVEGQLCFASLTIKVER